MSSASAPSASRARPFRPPPDRPRSSTRTLCAEIARALPDRPFAVELWDGSRVEATRPGGPTFRARSPAAVGHVLRAPGQLGLGRAYVAGDLEPDDLDAALELMDEWQAPV